MLTIMKVSLPIIGHYHINIYFFPQEGDLYPEHIMSHIIDKPLLVGPVCSRIRIVWVSSLKKDVLPHSLAVFLRDLLKSSLYRIDCLSQFRPADAISLCWLPCFGSTRLSIRRRRRFLYEFLILHHLPVVIPDERQCHPIQRLRQKIFIVLVRLVISQLSITSSCS